MPAFTSTPIFHIVSRSLLVALLGAATAHSYAFVDSQPQSAMACQHLFQSIEKSKKAIVGKTASLKQHLLEIESLEAKIAPLEVYVAKHSDLPEYTQQEANTYNQKLDSLRTLVAVYNRSVNDYDSEWNHHRKSIETTNVAINHYTTECVTQTL